SVEDLDRRQRLLRRDRAGAEQIGRSPSVPPPATPGGGTLRTISHPAKEVDYGYYAQALGSDGLAHGPRAHGRAPRPGRPDGGDHAPRGLPGRPGRDPGQPA